MKKGWLLVLLVSLGLNLGLGLRQWQIRQEAPARPGDQLRMEVKVTKARGDAFKFRGETFIDGKLAAEAEFMAMVVTVAEPAA